MVVGVFICLELIHRQHHPFWLVQDTWKSEITAFEMGIMLGWLDQVGLEVKGQYSQLIKENVNAWCLLCESIHFLLLFLN